MPYSSINLYLWLGPQLELYILGNSVGVTVCVLHPGTNKNNIDIITYHPDSNVGTWPEIHLVFRENLKQYCVILR